MLKVVAPPEPEPEPDPDPDPEPEPLPEPEVEPEEPPGTPLQAAISSERDAIRQSWENLVVRFMFVVTPLFLLKPGLTRHSRT